MKVEKQPESLEAVAHFDWKEEAILVAMVHPSKGLSSMAAVLLQEVVWVLAAV